MDPISRFVFYFKRNKKCMRNGGFDIRYIQIFSDMCCIVVIYYILYIHIIFVIYIYTMISFDMFSI